MSPAEYRARFCELQARKLDFATHLTSRQWFVLAALSEHVANTVRGLAAAMGSGKPAVTRAIDTLSRQGLVLRQRDPRDGRNVLLSITDRGAKVVTVMFGPAPGEAVAVEAKPFNVRDVAQRR